MLLAKSCTILFQVEGDYKVRAVTQDGKKSEVKIVTVEDKLEPTMVDFVIEDEATKTINPGQGFQ